MKIGWKRWSVLPGFGLAMGYTLTYLSLLVLIPLAGTFLKSATLTWPEFWETITSPRALASYRVTFGTSLVAALLNAVDASGERRLPRHRDPPAPDPVDE